MFWILICFGSFYFTHTPPSPNSARMFFTPPVLSPHHFWVWVVGVRGFGWTDRKQRRRTGSSLDILSVGERGEGARLCFGGVFRC